jgi:hypothetical protein
MDSLINAWPQLDDLPAALLTCKISAEKSSLFFGADLMHDKEEATDQANQQEANYWFIICEFVELLKQHGYERVMNDVDKRRFQGNGNSNSNVPFSGPSWD